MRPSLIALSKASRFPLSSKHGNKDYYKGTNQAQPPGIGFRTGASGKFIVKGTGKFRIVDEMVRIFIGPGFQEEGKATFLKSQLRPFVHIATPADQGFSAVGRKDWYDEATVFMSKEPRPEGGVAPPAELEEKEAEKSL